jgi:ubiquinone/menaquinone biosynthesis C-methylase UbiE
MVKTESVTRPATLEYRTLSADTAHRFRAVAEILEGSEADFSDTPTILDVGGYPGTFSRFLSARNPGWKVMTLDRPEDDITNYISGSGTRLPFDPKSFDAVVSIDVFEHVAPDERQTFVSEITRVARKLVILAAPFHHNATAQVERLLDKCHQTLFGAAHPWLSEHVENGLPSLPRTVEKWPTDCPVIDVRRSYDLSAWTTWQMMSLGKKLRGELDNAFERYDAAFAEAPTPAITEVPYRYLIVARRGTGAKASATVVMPAPDAGKDAVGLARVGCRLLELSAGPAKDETETNVLKLEIEHRLKEAIAANEQEIARLKDGGGASPGGKLRRLFGG